MRFDGGEGANRKAASRAVLFRSPESDTPFFSSSFFPFRCTPKDYAAQIREEYLPTVGSEEAFRARRADFLESLLRLCGGDDASGNGKESLFRTPICAEAFEAAARQNLQWELKALRSP